VAPFGVLMVGRVYISRNEGVSWGQPNSRARLSQMYFLSSNIGGVSGKGLIFKSTDQCALKPLPGEN